MRPKVLITGFEPFRGKRTNLSWLVARAFAGSSVGPYRCVVRRLPVAYARLRALVPQMLRRVAPAIVLMMGEAPAKAKVTWERLAVNVMHARGADNRGMRLQDQRIVPAGPAAYWGTLPADPALEGLRRGARGSRLSFHAGTFCCNEAFYLALHAAHRMRGGCRVGFVHLPCVPTGTIPKATLALRVRQVRACLSRLVDVLEEENASREAPGRRPRSVARRGGGGRKR